MLTTADAAALEILSDASIDPTTPTHPVAIARGLLGRPDAVQPFAGLPVRACYIASEGLILVRPGLAPRQLAYLVAHELAEHHLGSYAGRDRERLANAIGAAILLPEPAVRLSLARGRDGVRLAHEGRTTQSIAWLRIAEVTQCPAALVMPGRVRTTGGRWPRDLWAQATGKRPTGLYRQAITDARGRVMVTE